MRAVVWLVILFALAVALALFAGDNQSTVTLFWPPHRVDLSLNLALILLAGLFALVYLALRTWAILFDLPRQARRWREQQRERAAHAQLLDALIQLLAGRYLRARKAAENALARSGSVATEHNASLRALAHLIASESAHALQNPALREVQWRLAQAEASAATGQGACELREGLLLRAAHWALQEQDPQTALARLEELPQGAARRTLALRERLKAAHLAGRNAQALETARLLGKHRALSPEAARSLRRGLIAELLTDAVDAAQLALIWNGLNAAERASPDLAVRAAQRLIALDGASAQACAWLRPAWDAMLSQPEQMSPALRAMLAETVLAAMARARAEEAAAGKADGSSSGSGRDWLARIEQAQQAWPLDASLQYLCGMACMHCQLWGRAQYLLAEAAENASEPALRRNAWRALAQMAEQRGDAQAAARAWRQAALV
ncbi:MAG: heme biosynthesis protein HemY [Burkholderiaceae bacterium]|jgi:HemY protein|nr:heme biosynthesis protein HemY [Burkholderiaceae bacterium]